MKINPTVLKCRFCTQIVLFSLLIVFSFTSLLHSQELDKIFNDSIPILIPYPSPTIEQQPTLQWHKPAVEVAQYFIQISTDPSFAITIVYVSASDTLYTSTIDLPIDTIYWRVKADDFEWSDISSFIIRDARIPVLIPYENPTFEQKPTLQWYAAPVQISSYNIQISTNSLFDTLEIDVPITDTFYTCQADLPLGMIYWRVRSDSSEYSDMNSFEIKDSRIPLLIPYEPKVTSETQPALTWRSVADAITYTVEIDNNSDFSSTIMSMPLSDTTFTPFEPLPIGEIYWRVKSDLVDTWSDVDHFNIQPDSIPLLVRFNGEIIDSKKPEFKWHPVQDADSYKFMLADNANFASAIVVPLNDTVYTSDIALDYGTWFWKVSCSKNMNLYSPVDSLVIDSSVTFINQNVSLSECGASFQKRRGSVKIVLNGIVSKDVYANVYNLNGRIVSTLKPVDEKKNILIWNYNNGYVVNSGMYIIRLKTREKVYIHKVIVSK